MKWTLAFLMLATCVDRNQFWVVCQEIEGRGKMCASHLSGGRWTPAPDDVPVGSGSETENKLGKMSK